MARPSSSDPLDKFRWAVSIDGFSRLGFTQCDVPSMTINTKTYPEGGDHLHPKKIVNSVSYKPVTLTRGVTKDESFYGWIRQIYELHKGISQTSREIAGSSLEVNTFFGANDLSEPVRSNTPVEYRRDVTIHHLDRQGRIAKTYNLINAFPVGFEPASSFSSDADDGLSMEKLVLEYESFEVISSDVGNNPFDVRDVGKRLIRSF